MSTENTGLYRLDDAAHATVLAALRLYQYELGQPGSNAHALRFQDIATDDNTLKPLDARQIDALCESLNHAGLTFGEVVRLVGESGEQSPYVAAAREHPLLSEGTLEVDDKTVVSHGADEGAYVMAWLWIDNDAAGVEPEPGEGEPHWVSE